MSGLDHTALGRIRTIDITTTGCRSGRPVRIEIWWFRFEDRFIIAGTPGPRDWLANVMADPRMIVHAGDVDVDATASLVADPEFRRRFFSATEPAWYRTQAELDVLVAEAPMIELTLGG